MVYTEWVQFCTHNMHVIIHMCTALYANCVWCSNICMCAHTPPTHVMCAGVCVREVYGDVRMRYTVGVHASVSVCVSTYVCLRAPRFRACVCVLAHARSEWGFLHAVFSAHCSSSR